MKSIIIALALSVVSATTHAASQPNAKVNLNQATVTELTQSIKGIGKKRAEAIIQYRQTHGQFKSIDDLAKVHGLGNHFVQSHKTQLQERLTF